MRTLRARASNADNSSLANNKLEKCENELIDDDVGADGDETTDDEGGVDTPPPPKDDDDDDSKEDVEEKSKVKPDKKETDKVTRTRHKKGSTQKIDADDEYEVEQIVDMEVKSRRHCPVIFRVRWVGYGEKDDSWLPATELNCDELIQDFLEISGRKSEYDKAMESRKREAQDPDFTNGIRQSKRKTCRVSYSELEKDEDEILPSGTRSRGHRIQFEKSSSLTSSRQKTPKKKIKKRPPKEEKPKFDEDYEVESISGMREIHGYPEYKVKWKGWSTKYNSWLKEKELNCPEILEKFTSVLNKLEKQEDWQVESIVNMREKKGKREFLIRWKGFDSKSDTWEPEDNLEGCKDILQKFVEKEEKGKEKLLSSKRRTRDLNERACPERFVENFANPPRAKSKRNKLNISYTEEED